MTESQPADRRLPSAGFSEGSVEVDGTTIHYWSGGQGQPIVHLHGAGVAHREPVHMARSVQHDQVGHRRAECREQPAAGAGGRVLQRQLGVFQLPK